MLCKYALNINNELVFIDDVENGKLCNCHCPSCGEDLVAKNNGTFQEHHFAHLSGSECKGYRETLLHIWSKQIIEDNKTLSIPRFKGRSNGVLLINPYDEKDFGLEEQKLHFATVEIEKRIDVKELQPDIVGTTKDGLRLWIEIYVRHKCSEEKISKIIENGINCIEIKIPDFIETKEQLADFLINSTDSELKCFINYPFGESIIQNNKKEYYAELMQKCKKTSIEDCNRCFKEIVLPKNYTRLLDEFRDRLSKEFLYIFKCQSFKILVEKYPNLKYLDNAIIHKRCSFKKNSISALSEQEFENTLEFCCRLSILIKFYDYGSINSFHWNCAHIYAESIKDEKEYVFCLNKQ